MQQNNNRSSLFLLELIIAIAFFCIASAVCVQIFVKSHTIEQESTALNRAVHLATSTAETFRSFNLDSFEAYYDKDWVECDKSDAFYTLKFTVEGANSLQNAQIRIEANNYPIYELEVLKNANLEVLP